MKKHSAIALVAAFIFSKIAFAKDFILTEARGVDCLYERVISNVLTKNEIQSGNYSGKYISFITDLSCSDTGVQIGIDGENFPLKSYFFVGLGLPLEYYSEAGSIRVKIEHVSTIFEDKKNSVVMDSEATCIPAYRKVRVSINFRGVKKVVYGTAFGNCP